MLPIRSTLIPPPPSEAVRVRLRCNEEDEDQRLLRIPSRPQRIPIYKGGTPPSLSAAAYRLSECSLLLPLPLSPPSLSMTIAYVGSSYTVGWLMLATTTHM